MGLCVVQMLTVQWKGFSRLRCRVTDPPSTLHPPLSLAGHCWRGREGECLGSSLVLSAALTGWVWQAHIPALQNHVHGSGLDQNQSCFVGSRWWPACHRSCRETELKNLSCDYMVYTQLITEVLQEQKVLMNRWNALPLLFWHWFWHIAKWLCMELFFPNMFCRPWRIAWTAL